VVAAVAIALAGAPARAQQKQEPRPAAKVEAELIGLPIFSADGKRIGKVLAVGTDEDDHPVLVGEIERPLGMVGAELVAIPTDMFVRKTDRIELAITAAEIRSKLSRKEPEP